MRLLTEFFEIQAKVFEFFGYVDEIAMLVAASFRTDSKEAMDAFCERFVIQGERESVARATAVKTMTDADAARDAVVCNDSSIAYREFCYRWTCSCGHDNRVGEIVAGKSNVCRICNKAVRIKTIVYDNGAVCHIR